MRLQPACIDDAVAFIQRQCSAAQLLNKTVDRLSFSIPQEVLTLNVCFSMFCNSSSTLPRTGCLQTIVNCKQLSPKLNVMKNQLSLIFSTCAWLVSAGTAQISDMFGLCTHNIMHGYGCMHGVTLCLAFTTVCMLKLSSVFQQTEHGFEVILVQCIQSVPLVVQGLDLPALFAAVEGSRATLQVEDYSLSQTTLEQVFVALAQQNTEQSSQ